MTVCGLAPRIRSGLRHTCVLRTPYTSAIAPLAFLLFALAAIVAPGIQLQRRLGGGVDPALVLPIGFVFASAAYGAASVFGIPWVFVLLVLAPCVDLALLRAPWRREPSPDLRGALLPIAAIVCLFALTEYRQNRVAANGDFLFDRVDPEDQAFHAGLTHELSHGYPPQVPGLSGYPLAYHFGWPFVRAAAARYTGLTPYDLMSRYDLTLAAIALVLAVRAATAALGGSALAVALAPWTLLLCGYSWVLSAHRAEWWFAAFPGELLPDLFHANSVVPALAIAIACLLCANRGRLALAALLAAALPFFKIFLAAQILAGLCAAFVLVKRRGATLAVALPMLAATLFLVASEEANTRVRVALEFLGPILRTRQTLRLATLTGTSLLAFAAFWLVLSLGARLLSGSALWRAMRSQSVVAVTLATAAIIGWPLGLIVSLRTAEPYSRVFQADDALYFMDQSGPLLWIFAVLAVAAWRSRFARGLALAAMALGLVSTAQYVAHKWHLKPTVMPAAMVRAMNELAADARPGDVVLQVPGPKRYPPPPLVLIPLRIPYTQTIPYMTQFASRADLDTRLALVRRFFATDSAAEAREIAAQAGRALLRAVRIGHRQLRPGRARGLPQHLPRVERLCLRDPAAGSASTR